MTPKRSKPEEYAGFLLIKRGTYDTAVSNPGFSLLSMLPPAERLYMDLTLVYGVVERPVPQEGFASAEHPWPTQPFPVKPVPLARSTFPPADVAKVTPRACGTLCSQMNDAAAVL